VAAQAAVLTATGAVTVFRETASGAKADRAQLRKIDDPTLQNKQLTVADVSGSDTKGLN
jgi:hypothetical protein